MWTPLITLYALVLLALIVATGTVAVFTIDQHRADRATGVLKLLLAATLGTTGLFTFLTRLHNAGLL